MAETHGQNTFAVIDGGLPDEKAGNFHVGKNKFGGGGGGNEVDAETNHYVDANVRAAKAENSASFARLETKIDGISPGASWQQMAGVVISGVVVGLSLVFAVLAYASDRFDSGVASMGAIEELLDTQREQNVEQNERIDRILVAIEKLSAATDQK